MIDLSSVKEASNTKNVYVSGGGNFDIVFVLPPVSSGSDPRRM